MKICDVALSAVGKVMYIYGGGWNNEDNAGNMQAQSIGISPQWQAFADKQQGDYNFKAYNCQQNPQYASLGLDCSGFIGWVLHNTFGCGDFVAKSVLIPFNLEKMGLGTITDTPKDYRAGDIMASKCDCCRHIYIVLDYYSDGSLLFVHSTPPGVAVYGTCTPLGDRNSIAIKNARLYMQKNHPLWYERFPQCEKGIEYLTHYRQFRWHSFV